VCGRACACVCPTQTPGILVDGSRTAAPRGHSQPEDNRYYVREAPPLVCPPPPLVLQVRLKKEVLDEEGRAHKGGPSLSGDQWYAQQVRKGSCAYLCSVAGRGGAPDGHATTACGVGLCCCGLQRGMWSRALSCAHRIFFF